MEKALVFIFAALCVFAFQQAGEGDSRFFQFPSGSAITSDTITNAENDTINLPNVLTLWETAVLDVHTTQLSGTENLILIVQGSAKVSPVAWHEVARDTFSANEDLKISFGPTDLYKYRYIIDGSGTQSTTYGVKALYKRSTN